MATNDAIRTLNTKITLEASGAQITDGSFVAANDNDLVNTDIDGMPLAIFEFHTESTGFSAAPTDGAVINLYERKYLTGGTNQAPVPDATYRYDLLGSFVPDVADAQQYLRLEGVPINFLGGTYYLEWVDGGAGTASIDAGWELYCTPYTFAPAP